MDLERAPMTDETTTTAATPDPEIKALGDKIAELTLKQAVDLKDYLKEIIANHQHYKLFDH